MTIEFTRVGDVKCQLGEGPLWDCQDQVLYWVDSLAHRLYRHNPADGTTAQWAVPGPIGSLALRQSGGAVLAAAGGFFAFDFPTGSARAVAVLEDEASRTRMNDGKVDREGRFIAGSMANSTTGERTGAMYRLATDLSVTRLGDGIGIFNGPCFSPDGRRFYYADSDRQTIWACNYAVDGTIADRMVLVDTRPLNSLPDGATVDSNGNIWVALVSAGAIACFSPQGRLLRRIATPVRFPSSVNFGGPRLDVLYITSISKSLRFDAPEAGSGGVFAIHGLGVHGIAEPRFAG